MQRTSECETAEMLTPWQKAIGPFTWTRTVVWDGVHPKYYAYILRYHDRWEFDFTHVAFATPLSPERTPPHCEGGWEEWFSLRCSCLRWTLGCDKHRFCGLCPQCCTMQEIQDNALRYSLELDRRGEQDRFNRAKETQRVAEMATPGKDPE